MDLESQAGSCHMCGARSQCMEDEEGKSKCPAPEMLELLTFFVDMVSAEPVHPMVYKAMKLLERLK